MSSNKLSKMYLINPENFNSLITSHNIAKKHHSPMKAKQKPMPRKPNKKLRKKIDYYTKLRLIQRELYSKLNRRKRFNTNDDISNVQAFPKPGRQLSNLKNLSLEDIPDDYFNTDPLTHSTPKAEQNTPSLKDNAISQLDLSTLPPLPESDDDLNEDDEHNNTIEDDGSSSYEDIEKAFLRRGVKREKNNNSKRDGKHRAPVFWTSKLNSPPISSRTRKAELRKNLVRHGIEKKNSKKDLSIQ